MGVQRRRPRRPVGLGPTRRGYRRRWRVFGVEDLPR